MELTKRQGEILNSIIKAYIDMAEPVSSKFLEKKYDFGICPATIRIEMQKLTDAGFIFQPYTSAGRIPTDRGYRFFVDELLEKELESFEMGDWFKEEIGDTIKFIQYLTKNLALASQALALSYFEKEKIFWKEGWEEIIKEPEFEEKKVMNNFIETIKKFEEEIDDLKINSGIKIYIGKENPFPKASEFSTIVSKCLFSEKENGILAIMGPKRMDYDRNINLLKNLKFKNVRRKKRTKERRGFASSSPSLRSGERRN